MSRPWLFLDLDGVVSPLLPREVIEHEQKFAIPAGRIRAAVAHPVGGRDTNPEPAVKLTLATTRERNNEC